MFSFIVSLIVYFIIFRAISVLIRFFFPSDSDEGRNIGGDYRRYTQSADYTFRRALLVVLAAEMNADGRVTRAELNVVKQVLVIQFGEAEAKEALLELRDILKTNQSVKAAAVSIWKTVDYANRLKILSILCDIADADGIVTREEVDTIVRIATYMGIAQYDIQVLIGRLNVNGDQTYGGGYYDGWQEQGRTYGQTDEGDVSLGRAYELLGVSASATNAEVKTAYKKMAMQYHPDRVASSGQDAVKAAEKKFKEIQSAYEKIKAARGLK